MIPSGAALDQWCTLDPRAKCDAGRSLVNAAKSLMTYHGIPAVNIGLTTVVGYLDDNATTFGPKDVATVSNFVVKNGIGAVTYEYVNEDCDFTGDRANCIGLGLGLPPFYFANAFGAASPDSLHSPQLQPRPGRQRHNGRMHGVPCRPGVCRWPQRHLQALLPHRPAAQCRTQRVRNK